MARDWALTLAFIDVESHFDRNAFLMDRNGGSVGLAQIDLPTARWAGFEGTVEELKDPFTNIMWLCNILNKLTADLVSHGKYSVVNLAAAYNSGLTHVLNGGTDQPYAIKITTSYAKFQPLNRTANGP
jgi:soluble lytic murein transglycosylase-like protein